MEIIIDGKVCEAKKGEYILDIAKRNDIYIPTLCHHDGLPGQGTCRFCIVEISDNGWKKVVTSCNFPVRKEIEIFTHSPKIMKMRKTLLQLMHARMPHNKQIEELAEKYNIIENRNFKDFKEDECILCGLCVRACEELGTNAISTVNRGISKKISTPYDEPSKPCIGCASCAEVCPTGFIKVTDSAGVRSIWNKDFELVKCQQCGEYFATKDQLEYIKNNLDTQIDESICSKCKKKQISENFKEVFKEINK